MSLISQPKAYYWTSMTAVGQSKPSFGPQSPGMAIPQLIDGSQGLYFLLESPYMDLKVQNWQFQQHVVDLKVRIWRFQQPISAPQGP